MCLRPIATRDKSRRHPQPSTHRLAREKSPMLIMIWVDAGIRSRTLLMTLSVRSNEVLCRTISARALSSPDEQKLSAFCMSSSSLNEWGAKVVNSSENEQKRQRPAQGATSTPICPKISPLLPNFSRERRSATPRVIAASSDVSGNESWNSHSCWV